MAWMIREDQLDPDQKEFINVESRKAGNIWIKGFAGSGKSVLLVHHLKDVLSRQPNATVAVVVYTKSLIDMFKTGMKEVGLPSNIPVMTYYEFVDKNTSHFDFIVCDEVQDLPSRVLYAMKSRSGKLIVAGDSNQSIYDIDPKWRDSIVQPSQIGAIIGANAFQLQMIHRLTRSIINAVQKLIPGMDIWGARRDTTKIDVNIRLCEARDDKAEIKYVFEESQKGAAVGDSSVILFPTNNDIAKFVNVLLSTLNKPAWTNKVNNWGKPDYGNLNSHLRSNDIKLQFIGSGYGSLADASSSRSTILMTYHSSKGLDFDNVFLPFLNNSLNIGSNSSETLFMVALTRSRKNLYLSYSGYTHGFVDRFKNDCTKISIAEVNNKTTATSSTNFDF